MVFLPCDIAQNPVTGGDSMTEASGCQNPLLLMDPEAGLPTVLFGSAHEHLKSISMQGQMR